MVTGSCGREFRDYEGIKEALYFYRDGKSEPLYIHGICGSTFNNGDPHILCNQCARKLGFLW